MAIINPGNVQIRDFQEITVAIDTLDDVFSDFDPRPLQQRALSEDFLKEIKKFYRETSPGGITVTFLGPVSLREVLNRNMLEKAIINHLRQEFRQRFLRAKKEIDQIRQRGLGYLLFGTALLLSLVLLGYTKHIDKFKLDLIGILLMPLGWFGIWDGFQKQVDIPFKLKDDMHMYEQLARAQYSFKFLGEPVIRSSLPQNNIAQQTRRKIHIVTKKPENLPKI